MAGVETFDGPRSIVGCIVSRWNSNQPVLFFIFSIQDRLNMHEQRHRRAKPYPYWTTSDVQNCSILYGTVRTPYLLSTV